MPAVDAWARQLAAVVLLAGVTEMLLPSGAFRGYARALLSLLVMLAVLRPAIGLFEGRLTLTLPSLSQAASTGAGAASVETALAQRAWDATYSGLVAAAAQRIAAGVPGVRAATVTLGLDDRQQPPAVVSVTADVLPAGPPADFTALAVGVRTALAAGLQLPPSAVAVHVG